MYVHTAIHHFPMPICTILLTAFDADFTIALPPVVNITPSSITASEGDMVTFICLATGVSASNFAYEWSLNGSLINGVTEQIYNVSVTADTSSKSTIGNYKCTVTNQYGNSSQSNIATLILSK